MHAYVFTGVHIYIHIYTPIYIYIRMCCPAEVVELLWLLYSCICGNVYICVSPSFSQVCSLCSPPREKGTPPFL